MAERSKTELRDLLRDPRPTSREDNTMPTTELDDVSPAELRARRSDNAARLEDRIAQIADAAMKEDTARILEILDRPTGDILTIDQRARLAILGEVLTAAPAASLPEVLTLARWVEVGVPAAAGEYR